MFISHSTSIHNIHMLVFFERIVGEREKKCWNRRAEDWRHCWQSYTQCCKSVLHLTQARLRLFAQCWTHWMERERSGFSSPAILVWMSLIHDCCKCSCIHRTELHSKLLVLALQSVSVKLLKISTQSNRVSKSGEKAREKSRIQTRFCMWKSLAKWLEGWCLFSWKERMNLKRKLVVHFTRGLHVEETFILFMSSKTL